MAEATMSVGSTLTMSDTAAGTYTTVAGVKSIRWRGTAGAANASALADTLVVKLPKRLDYGDLSCGAIYGKTQFHTLFDVFNTRAKKYWKVTGADGSVLGPLYGFVSDLSEDVPEDDPITSDVTITLSGDGTVAPDFTPAV